MFVDRRFAVRAVVEGKRDDTGATRTSRFVVRADLATTLKTSASPTASALLTTDETQSGSTGGTQVVIVAGASRPVFSVPSASSARA